MTNNKTNHETDIKGEEVPIDNKVDDVEVPLAHYQLTHSDREEDGLLTRRRLSQRCEPTATSSLPRLLALPAELRNKIYSMVIDDIPDIITMHHRAVGQYSLRQPALAKVNRQLRSEILPIFFHKKSFGIRIYPKKHSEVDEVWNSFLNRFAALAAGFDGVSCLSRIRRLEVELWHPAFNSPLRRRPRSYQDDHGTPPDEFPLRMCDGVYLQFGADPRSPCKRVGSEDQDWTNRDSVKAVLTAALVQNRMFPHIGMSTTRAPESFWETYPFERLVDLLMMIAAECKMAARVIRVGTSFAPRY